MLVGTHLRCKYFCFRNRAFFIGVRLADQVVMAFGGKTVRWRLMFDSSHLTPPVIDSGNAHRSIGNPPCGSDSQAGDVTLRPCLIGGLSMGSSNDLDTAKAEFRAAWEALKARTTPARLAAAYKAMNIRDDD